jgi:hypothetical protein
MNDQNLFGMIHASRGQPLGYGLDDQPMSYEPDRPGEPPYSGPGLMGDFHHIPPLEPWSLEAELGKIRSQFEDTLRSISH